MGGPIGFVFGTFGLLFAAIGIGTFVLVVRKAATYKRTQREGLVAEARCLETFVVHSRSSNGTTHSRRRLILGFMTSDGRAVRAEVTSHQPHVMGDIVLVRYLPQSPDRAVPAGAPSGMGAASCFAGGMMVVFTCIGLFIAALGFGLALTGE